MYDREYSLQELEEKVASVKPFKVITKGRGSYYENGRYRYEENVTEGFDVSMVQSLVDQIEVSKLLTVDQKIRLERTISNKITKENYGGIRLINRGALNVLLMVRNGATAFTRGHKLSSLQGLKKHGLVYTDYKKVIKTITIPAIEGVLGSEALSEEKTIYVYILSLTEYGKSEARQLSRQGEKVAQKDLRNLQKLGLI